MTAWVRAGHLPDAPHGHVALLALCGTELTASRIALIADELRDRPLDQVTDIDIAIAMMTETDRLPRPVEVERLKAVLVDGDRC